MTTLNRFVIREYIASEMIFTWQNGGDFDFVIKPGTIALPTDPQFWDYLFSVSLEEDWNLIAYKQDWLSTQMEHNPALQVCMHIYTAVYNQSNVTLGKSWLMEMGNAAQRHGLTIQ